MRSHQESGRGCARHIDAVTVCWSNFALCAEEESTMTANRMSRRRLVLASAAAGIGAGNTLGHASATSRAQSSRYRVPAIIGQAKTTVTWAIPGNPDEVAVYEQLAEEFMAQNPDIEVTTDREGSDFEKFVTLIAAGTPPDLGFATLYNWPSFAERDIFIALDDFIEQDSYDIEDFYDQIITPVSLQRRNIW